MMETALKGHIIEALSRDTGVLSGVSAALWALVGQEVTTADLFWARRLIGDDGPRLLYEILMDSQVVQGIPPTINARYLARTVAEWAGVEFDNFPHTSSLPSAQIVYTLPDIHPLASLRGRSLLRAAEDILQVAKREVVICSPYLNIRGGGYLLEQLCAASLRGADITFITHNLHDIASENAKVVEMIRRELRGAPSTMHLYSFSPSFQNSYQPYLLHAKVLMADNRKALVGSANLTAAGLTNNFEVATLVEGNEVLEIARVVKLLTRTDAVVKYS